MFVVMLVFVLGAGAGEAAQAAGAAGIRGPFGDQVVVPGLNLALSTNQTSYTPGSLHVLSASASTTTAVAADVYVVVQLPTGQFFSLSATGGVTPGLVPFFAGLNLPAGFSVPTGPIFSITLPTLPVGTYTWLGAFTAPGTLDPISNLAQASWTFSTQPPPPPPPPPPPTSPVVWVPDYFGNKVQVRIGEGASTFGITLVLGAPDCSPNSVAVNSGKLYVVCNIGNEIRVYDANAIKAAAAGSVLTSQPVEKNITDGEFNDLIGITFDAQNNLWVASNSGAEFGTGGIFQVSAAQLAQPNPTVTIRLPDTPSSPVALVFDTDGSFWATGLLNGGILLNLTSDQFDQGIGAAPRYCISNADCDPHGGLFNFPEGVALFNGKVWVSNNGGGAPGQQLVPFTTGVAPALIPGTVFSGAPFVCPGGLFASPQHLWVNDQGFNDSGGDCGSTDPDKGSGVGAVLRFTPAQLNAHTTDPAQIVRFSNITSRPGFGGIFIEGD
jgi:hypothetical protein